MRILLITLVSSIFLILTFSCHRKGSPEDLKNIDSLIAINDSIGVALAEVDSSAILRSRETFANHWKIISPMVDSLAVKNEVRTDSMWQYISLYEAKDRQVKKLMRRYRHMMDVYKINRHQLSTFHQSVANGQIPSDSVPIYTSREGLEVYALQQEVQLYLDDLISSAATLDSLHHFAPAAIDHYKNAFRKHTRVTVKKTK